MGFADQKNAAIGNVATDRSNAGSQGATGYESPLLRQNNRRLVLSAREPTTIEGRRLSIDRTEPGARPFWFWHGETFVGVLP